MQKEKLIKMLGILFASKLKNPDKETILIWYDLLKNYPDDLLEKYIKKLIYTKDDFISIGQLHEMIYPDLQKRKQIENQFDPKKYLDEVVMKEGE